MTGVIGLISLMIALYVPSRLRSQALAAEHDEASTVAQMTAFSVSTALLFDDRIAAREMLRSLQSDEDFVYAVVTGLRNENFVITGEPAPPARVKNEMHEVSVPINHDGSRIGTLRLGMSLKEAAEGISAARRDVQLMSLGLFVVGVFASFALSTLITRPLRRIADAADEVRKGKLNVRAHVRARDEVGALATTFNMMLDGLVKARNEMEGLNLQLEAKVDELNHLAEDRRQLADRVTLLLESTGDGIIATDSTGHCVMVNRAAKGMLGAGEIIGRQLSEFIPAADESRQSVDERTLNAATAVRGDGSSFSVDVAQAPIVEDGRKIGVVVSFRDVTERNTLQKRLDSARRLGELGQLAATVAHEFNNVLMGIQPFVEIVRRQVPDNPRVVKSCESMLQSIKRGKRVTGEVLQYTRQSEPKLVPFDAGSWLREFAVGLGLAMGERHRINLSIPDEPLFILGDREQLEQVFTNLVSNARDATRSGGSIIIHARRATGRPMVHFAVIDNGSGMPQDVVDRIFEPFFSTKRLGGTGLGLAVAHKFITLHGGEIRAESSPDVGTTFHIDLPASEETSVPAPATAVTVSSPSLLEERVMVVEDDQLVATGLLNILREAGAEVELVVEGAAVLTAVERFQPSVIILDIGLPDIDGATVYRQLQMKYPHMPVVFSTGHGDESKLADILVQPHTAFLLKPYPEEMLLASVAEVRSVGASPVTA